MQYVYFVQAQTLGLVKIGAATRLEKRLRDLALASPDRLTILGARRTDAACSLEAALHAEFAQHRLHGEWFSPSPTILDYVATRAVLAEKALARLNGVLSFPTMPRGRPTKEMMRQRALAGLEKWH